MEQAIKHRGCRAIRSCAAILAGWLLASDADAAGGSGSFADRLQACTFRHPVTDIPLLSDLPPAVRIALLKYGAMAEKGEKFNSTDVIVMDPSGKTPALPGTRFLRAGQWRAMVFVWYEAGGIALFHRLALYRLDADGTAQEITNFFDGGHDPCALTDAVLDGNQPPP